jgi:hypothetical protein
MAIVSTFEVISLQADGAAHQPQVASQVAALAMLALPCGCPTTSLGLTFSYGDSAFTPETDAQ